MAEIASVINVVAWGTRLSLSLYDFGIANAAATRQANKIAKSVSMLTLMLKQVGTLLKEDTTTPSIEAVETVQDIVLHTNNAFAAIEALIPVNPPVEAAAVESEPQKRKWDLVSTDNLLYLHTYVETLNSTLSVMLQALYTVRVIAWSRSRQDRLPASAADAVANECSQLEVLIVEQQLLLLELSDAYANYRRSCDFSDSPASSVHFDQKDFVPNQDKTPTPGSLDRYRDPALSDVEPNRPLPEISSLVRRHSPRFSNDILSRWTLLQEIEQRLAAPEDEIYKPLTPSQQRFGKLGRSKSYEVDAFGDESIPGVMRTGASHVESPKPQRPPMSPVGAMEHGARPIPIVTPLPTARGGQAFSPGSSNSLPAGYSVHPGGPRSMAYSPASPRTGFSNYYQPQPQARPTAVAENRPSTEVMLGIPWRLWLQSYHWDFTDDKVMNTNSQVPLDKAYTDRNGWTELMQTWVRREAIEEARLSFNQVQKEVQDGGRTRFETCFCIGKPLTYAEVRRLVDRSIEIYRATQYPPSLASNESAGTGPAMPSVSLPILNDATSSKSNRRGHSRHNSYYSTDPSSDDDYSDDARSSSRHHRRRGTESRESSRHWDRDRERERERRRRKDKGSSTFGTLARYGGIATLLEGLPEILKGL
ncbi:hypothetical protein HDK77DRAFT_11940 [Phyllosticta capitalensis]